MKLFKSLKSALEAKQEVRHLKLTLKGSFPQDVLDLTNLRELYLDGDCSLIPELHSLRDLELVAMTLPRIEHGMTELFNHPHLKNLKVIGAKIEEISIPEISELAPLQSLTFKECELSSLPLAIGRFHLLREMNLDGNLLTELPRSFKNLTYLKRLNLDRNRFEIFPSVLSEMPSLKHVSLDGNAFSEDEKARIQRLHHLTIH